MSKTFQEVRESVRRTLQDTDGNYWSDAEIDDYIDEGQLEFVRHTAALRGEAPITVRENQDAYTLPEDCIEILRVEDSEGNALIPTTSSDLQRRYGNFRNRTSTTGGEPEWYYSDLDGDTSIRFYPRPNPTIEEGFVSFSNTVSSDRNEEFTSQPLFMEAFEGDLYVGDGSKLYVFDSEMNLTQTIDHSATFTTSALGANICVGDTGASNSGVTAYISDGAATSKVYKIILSSGAVSLFGTASGQIDYMFPQPDSSFLVLNINDNIYSTAHGSYSETLRQSGTGKVFQVIRKTVVSDTNRFIAATETLGLVEMGGKGNINDTIDATAPCYGVTHVDDTLYYNRVTQIYQYASGTATDTTVDSYSPLSATALQLFTDGLRLFVPNSDGSDCLVTSYLISDWSTVETIDFGSAYSSEIPSAKGLEMFFGTLYGLSSEPVLAENDHDGGCVISVNSIDFNQDRGAVVDLLSSDNSDIIVFDGEFGAVVQITQSAVGAHVWYCRNPSPGIVEISDPLALEYYALYRAYEKDADQSNFSKGQYYFSKFWNIVSREKRKAAYGFNRSTEPSKGEYF